MAKAQHVPIFIQDRDEMTDVELLREYAATGSEEAFTQIVERHTSMVYGVCARMVGDPHAAEDATQATFLILARKAKRLAGCAALTGWLFATARNCSRHVLRSRVRRSRHEQEASMRKADAGENDLWEQVRPELDEVIGTLPRMQRNAVVMRYMDGLSEPRIAEALGCTRSAISTHLSRALEKIRLRLALRKAFLSTAVLATLLSEKTLMAAPAGLANSVCAICFGKAAAAPAVMGTMKGAMNMMLWAKVKLAATIFSGMFLVGVGGLGVVLAEEANLAPNPGAEVEDVSNLPPGWGLYVNSAAEAGITDKEFYTGKKCAYLKAKGLDGDGYVCMGLTVGASDGYKAPEGIPVEPNTEYHFSFYIAGIGHKRPITVGGWGFKSDGSERDKNLGGVEVNVTPKWQRVTGTFKTKAETGRAVLMFFVYSMQDRDINDGAIFYVDDVYVGKGPVPAAVPPQGADTVKGPPAGESTMKTREKGEGYRPLPPDTVRLWNVGRKLDRPATDHDFSLVPWREKDYWNSIPYDTTPPAETDLVLEGPNFWLNLSWRPFSGMDGPLLYVKKGASCDPSTQNLLYRVYYKGGRCLYGANLKEMKIVKNTPKEIVVETECLPARNKGIVSNARTAYRVQAGRPWVEFTSLKECDQTGIHGETRIVIAPEAREDGQDWVTDSDRDGLKDGYYGVPPKGRMCLAFSLDANTIWGFMWKPHDRWMTDTATRDGRGAALPRCYAEIYHGSCRKGWDKIGEGNPKAMVGATHVHFDGDKIVLAALPFYYWHYQLVNQDVTADKEVAIAWKNAELLDKNSPAESSFKTGGPWWPSYPGKWRLMSRIDGKCYSTTITVEKEGVGKKEFSWQPPVAGKLDYVLIYLYDRTSDTPKDIYTPMDIFREAIEEKPAP